MKILGIIFVLLIAYLQFQIWLGQDGVAEIDVLKLKIAEQAVQNDLLREQNKRLKKEILALQNNPAVLEEVAREKLGLVKPGETFYRVIPKDNDSKK